MADHRYRERPARGESIFDDDDRVRRGSYDEPRRSRDPRGFLERAGDELKSIFRDEDSGDRMPSSGAEHEDYAGSYGRHRGGSGGYGPRGEGRSHLDDHYASWRDRQISQFDRDYDDYRRERQQRFESDFDTWRRGRTAGGSTGASGVASGKTGVDGQAEGSGTTTGGSGTEPIASGSAGETGDIGSTRTGRARKTGR